MAEIEFHPLAIKEARHARRWYARVSGRLAARFMGALDAAVASVETNPVSHQPYFHGTRACQLNRFPYLLVFLELSPNRLLAVAVAHVRRRPGYWRRRLP